jgi:hypothetical protein
MRESPGVPYMAANVTCRGCVGCAAAVQRVRVLERLRVPSNAPELRQRNRDWTLDQATGREPTRERLRFGKPPPRKKTPRQKQDWFLEYLQGGRAHPLAACGVATLY